MVSFGGMKTKKKVDQSDVYHLRPTDAIPIYGIVNYVVRTFRAIDEGIDIDMATVADESRFSFANSFILLIYNATLTFGGVLGLEALLK